MQNYFNYFTEIEERFQRRRGTILLLSTLDWALIETWKEAGIPLAAVLRGIDAAFEKHAGKRSRVRKVNSLAYCAQEVLAAAEEMKEAAVGVAIDESPARPSGLESDAIATYLEQNAGKLEKATLPASLAPAARDTAHSLRELAAGVHNAEAELSLEHVEQRLSVLEEKLLAVLVAAASEDELVDLRAEARCELTPYRRKMPAAQLERLERQYVHKWLLDRHSLPRLSLFYMR